MIASHHNVNIPHSAHTPPVGKGAYRSAFEDYVVTIRRDSKRAWAGSVAFATQMRAMVP
jgi:hypothetical protein